MKRILFVLVFLCKVTLVIGSEDQPVITEVKRELFSVYKIPDSIYSVGYAKTKKGWEVYFIYSKNYRLESGPRMLFWNRKKAKYQKLGIPKNKKRLTIDELNSLEKFNIPIHDKYNYFRGIYYGYDQADWDVITDFGGKSNLSDLELEGLARAYWRYGIGFINPGNYYSHTSNPNWPHRSVQDSIDERSAVQIDSFLIYTERAIANYRIIAQRSPNYQVLVGHVRNKIANEYVDIFLHLSNFGQHERALEYMRKAEYDPSMLSYAKNILNGLPQGAIIFTDGDNDTYPLWYVQRVLGFRSDVAVINMSLLNFNSYSRWIFSGNPILDKVASKYGMLMPLTSEYYVYLDNEGRADTTSVDSLFMAYLNSATKNIKMISSKYVQVIYDDSLHIFELKSRFLSRSDLHILDMIENSQMEVYFSDIGDYPINNFLNTIRVGYNYTIIRSMHRENPHYDSLAVALYCLKDLERLEPDPITDYDTDRNADIFISRYLEMLGASIQYANANGNREMEERLVSKARTIYPDNVYHANSYWCYIIEAFYHTNHFAEADALLNSYLQTYAILEQDMLNWLETHSEDDQVLYQHKSWRYFLEYLIMVLEDDPEKYKGPIERINLVLEKRE